MKLSLEELKVESYSTQVCENELEELRGGTYSMCAWEAFQIIAGGASIYSLWMAYNCSAPSSGGPSWSGSGYDDSGNYYEYAAAGKDSLFVTKTVTQTGTSTTTTTTWRVY